MNHRFACITLALCLAALHSTADAEKRPITHEDVWLMKRVGTPALSPDGRLIVVPVTEPAYAESDKKSDLWLVPADGSAPPRRLTFSTSAEANPAWSPDSRRIAFAAKRDGQDETQIYVLDIAGGGEAERVTDVATGATRPAVEARRTGNPVFEHDVSRRARRRRESQADRGAQGAQVQRAGLRGVSDPPLGPLARRASPDAHGPAARRRDGSAGPPGRHRARRRPRVRWRSRQRRRAAARRLVPGRQHHRLHRDDFARPGCAGGRATVAVRDSGGRRRAAPPDGR